MRIFTLLLLKRSVVGLKFQNFHFGPVPFKCETTDVDMYSVAKKRETKYG
jgi:hypothetical protein